MHTSKKILHLFLPLVLLFSLGAQARPVSLEYTNADLVPVLKKLARAAGMNVYLSPEVQGKVTISMKNVEPEAALKLILSLQENEYRYKILKNTYVIASPEKLKEIPDDLLGK